MKKTVNHLESIYNKLSNTEQKSLLDYAEFLLSKSEHKTKIEQPVIIPRPEKEKVVHAIKRLSKSYHMIDKMKLFPHTSQLMTEHIMKGRPEPEVINELEVLFLEHYETYLAEIENIETKKENDNEQEN